MADYESHPEFDDELLSAYLDDELAPDERARVEERLAADPAARQMLEQLRSVSQAMQGLPPEAVGQDLRPAILEQAERAMLTSNANYPRLAGQAKPHPSPAKSADDLLPPFSVGRTRRGWLWAGLAVAAALLIAFLPIDEPNDELPDLARRSNMRRDEARSNEMRGDSEPAAPANAPVETAPASGRELADSRADREGAELSLAAPVTSMERAPSARSRSLAASGAESDSAVEADDAPAHSVDALAERGGGAMLSGAAGGRRAVAPMDAGAVDNASAGGAIDESVLAPSDEEPLVVHVNVTPTAFRNKAFDRVLLSNGIAVESVPAAEPSGAVPAATRSANRFADTPAEEELGPSTDESLSELQESPEVDLVFVEAPPEQILSCLKTINNDFTNYRAVEIEDLTPRDKSTAAKNLAVEQNWSLQFNRGSVPQQQKQQFREDAKFYYQVGEDDRTAAVGEPAAAVRMKTDSFGYGGGKAEKLARARRLQAPPQNARADAPQQVAQQQIARGSASDNQSAAETEAEQLGAVGQTVREGKLAATEAGDQLQVLFVLTPQNGEASSPPATNSPE